MRSRSRADAARSLLALLMLAVPAAGRAQDGEDCLACHAGPDPTMRRGGRTVRLQVDRAVLGRSVHRDLPCVECHARLSPDALPHASPMEPVDCSGCHGDVTGTHRFHRPAARGPGSSSACADCHGAHDILPPGEPGSRLHPSRLVETCGDCHPEVAARYADSEHGRQFAAGVTGAPSCVDCHDRPIVEARRGGTMAEHKLVQERLCLSCHLDDPRVRARVSPGAGFISAYEDSVHGRALAEGNGAAANCVDCHGSHEMKKGFEPTARVNKRHIQRTCGGCHAAIAEKYAASVHGVALARGEHESPVCTDCHGEHAILRHLDPRSPVAPANVSVQVCSPCHSSLRLAAKYGIASDRFKTFSDSFHGLAIRGGMVEVANCASCHGSHDIRPSSDPASSIHPLNLRATCGRCHPGAGRRFAEGTVHLQVSEEREPVLYWIATAYAGLIVVVIGGMSVHNLLDFVRKARRRLRIRRGLEPGEPVGRALYLRMTLGERLQHGALVGSFAVLVVTGFMLHYPDAWWVRALGRLSDEPFDLRGLLHRIAGVVMVGASLYHVTYLVFSDRGRRFLRDILPRRGDLSDAAAALRFNLGLSGRGPRFGRFGYVEKSEYWALVWGSVLMTLTGMVLWFEEISIGLLTKLGWEISRIVHFYEAWLAALAVLVWHLYHVILSPDAYPMNVSWLSGTLSEAEMAAEHPLELEAIRARRAADPGAARPTAGRRSPERT
ncbi:MAG: cytochrome b/b6 domain-containing protein [Acidobacteriota bacterium]